MSYLFLKACQLSVSELRGCLVTMWSVAALTGTVHARGHKANGIDLDVETHRIKDEDLANANPVPLPTTRSVLVCLRHAIVICA